MTTIDNMPLLDAMDVLTDLRLLYDPNYSRADDQLVFRDLQKRQMPDLDREQFQTLYAEWQDRYAAIRTTLERVRADVVVLNEAWQASSSEDQASALGRDLGLAAVARYLPHERGMLTGNAILTRWPILRTDSRLLSATRSVLSAEVDAPQGRLTAFATHLTWRPDHSRRRQQEVRQVLEFIGSQPRSVFPPVLMGDLNAEPGSDELRMLTGRMAVPVSSLVFADAWEQAGENTPGHTWDKSNPYLADEPWPSRRIDYILLGLPTAEPVAGWFLPLRCWVDGLTQVSDVQPSDHYAVVAELRCVRARGKEPHQGGTFGVDHVAG